MLAPSTSVSRRKHLVKVRKRRNRLLAAVLGRPLFLLAAFYLEPGVWVLTVAGMTAEYEVRLRSGGCFCECRAFGARFCSHVLFVLRRVAGQACDGLDGVDPRNFAVFEVFPDLTRALVAVLVRCCAAQPAPALEPDSLCCVCYEAMHTSETRTCEVCAKQVHSLCLQRWHAVKAECPLCRSNWARVDACLSRLDTGAYRTAAK